MLNDLTNLTFSLDQVQMVQDVFHVLGSLWGSLYFLIILALGLYILPVLLPKILKLFGDYRSYARDTDYIREKGGRKMGFYRFSKKYWLSR